MIKCLMLVLSFLITNQIVAQEKGEDSLIDKRIQANAAYTNLYKENGDLSYTSPKGDIGAPTGYVINGKLTSIFMVYAPANFPIAFSLTPDYRVRVREERSAGVRTPSFRFGGTLYVRLTADTKNYKYAQLSFTHHSNGQDEDAVLPDGNINTKTGNFNTNYLTASYVFGKFTNPVGPSRYFSFNHKVELEWHKWFNYESALIGDYGFTRLNYDFSFRVYQTYNATKKGFRKVNSTNELSKGNVEKEQWRFNAQVSYAINKYDSQNFFNPKRRLNVEASANYSLPFMQNVFIMAAFGYYGEDPYNIYFKDKYAYMRFGLSSTFSRFLSK